MPVVHDAIPKGRHASYTDLRGAFHIAEH